MKLFIGIDPGKSGGIGCAPETGDAWCYKMPETDVDLFYLFSELRGQYERVHAFLENVHSMPGQGVASSFTFGEGYGKLQMALIASAIPYDKITPQRWQKTLGCLTGGQKNISKARAQELFPHIRVTHAIADALLIAEYGRRTHK